MNPETIQESMRLWREDPSKAKVKPTLKARSDGAQVVLETGPFSWRSDLPPSLGGTNAAPSPTALLLSALAGCVVVFIRDTLASQLGVQLESVEAVVQCEADFRGALGMAWCLEKLAEAAHRQGRPETAVKFFGAAAALRVPIGSAIDLINRPDHERIIAELCSTLGDHAFATSWAAGEALSLREAIDEALAESGESVKSSARADKEKPGGLTAREREVAALIAQGRANRDIAEALAVELKTVEAHITRILNKLGFDNRVQIATWAVSRGLAPPSER